MSDPSTLTDYEKQILANVQDHGCHITYVFDPDGNEPDFAYSVGFPQTVGQPEIIVFGLGQDVMHFMINETYRQCTDGLVLSDWATLTGLIDGYDCVARAVPPRAIEPEYFSSAMWFEERRTGKDMAGAYQIVWPGAVTGFFPWEDGCSDDVRAWQVPLYATSLNS